MIQYYLISLLLLADEVQQKPLLLRLDDATRAKVLAALAGLVILGFLMIVLTWLGARWTRRYMGPKLEPTADSLKTDADWTRPQPEPPAASRKKKG